MGREVLGVWPFSADLHAPGTRGADGLCSWHCPEPAVHSARVREARGDVSMYSLCEEHWARVEEFYGAT